MAKAIVPQANEKDKALMEALLAKGRIVHKYAVRLQAAPNRAKGVSTTTVASVPGINPNSVSNHVKRYNGGGVDAPPRDKTGKPGKAPIPTAMKNKPARFVCREKPGSGTHRSARELSPRFGISHTAVNTILKGYGIKPHPVRRFQFGTDKEFESKLADVAGLYLDPPENPIVFRVDEKTQIQALERTRPILPLRPGIPEGQTRDYHRHGTTALFAALDVAGGEVTGKCGKSHKAEDYAGFLKLPDRKAPKKKVLHIIADNYSSHKAPAVKEYLQGKKGRFVEHFIPAYSSWLNMVERRFAEITNKRIRRESRGSLKELEDAIVGYIISWNRSGRRFCRTKTFDEIKTSIEKVKSGL